MRSLVTGGAGFIGSNLVDALVERGDDVLVLDNLSSGKRSNLDGALERGASSASRRTSPTATRSPPRLRSHRPEQVFHLAAQIDVRVSVADPGFDLNVNVGGTINLLNAAVEAGASGSCSPPRGEPSTARAKDATSPCRRAPTAGPTLHTACRSSRRRGTSTSSQGFMGFPRLRCGWGMSMARGRTHTGRRA